MRSLRPWLAVLLVLAPFAGAEAEGLDFAAWLEGVKAEARGAGIGEATLAAAFAGVAPIAKVIELDRRQPEARLSLEEYLDLVVPASRVAAARERLARHRALLAEVGARYGVQPRFVVALWGVESDFGRNTGGFPVIAALATLAFDGRRADFFRGELMSALRILDEGHVSAAEMTGSWAGAMGQGQFMPSSFESYAVDHDGDGRRDIWRSLPDVFASIANYLARHGWRDDQTWGREVRLPPGFAEGELGLEVARPIADWQRLGVRRSDGGDLPARALAASIVRPDGANGRAFMVYQNFRTTLDWNRSTYFALAIGLLADRLGDL